VILVAWWYLAWTSLVQPSCRHNYSDLVCNAHNAPAPVPMRKIALLLPLLGCCTRSFCSCYSQRSPKLSGKQSAGSTPSTHARSSRTGQPPDHLTSYSVRARLSSCHMDGGEGLGTASQAHCLAHRCAAPAASFMLDNRQSGTALQPCYLWQACTACPVHSPRQLAPMVVACLSVLHTVHCPQTQSSCWFGRSF
jgi:hypothetical protein